MIRWFPIHFAGSESPIVSAGNAPGLRIILAVVTAALFCMQPLAFPAQTPSKTATHAQAEPQKPAAQPAASKATPSVALDDEAARSQAILAHLNAVLRYYRDAESPIQKTGEPSDLVYRNEAVNEITQMAGFAFQWAKAEAGLMDGASQQPQTSGAASDGQANRIQQARAKTEQTVAMLKAQRDDLEKGLGTAPARQRASLQQQIARVDGELELQTAMEDALGRIAGMTGASGETGLAGQVMQLEHSAPGVTAKKSTAVAPTLENFNSARNAGVTTQAEVLFDLLSTRGAIDNLLKEADRLHRQAQDLQKPLVVLIRSTIAQGQALSQASTAAAAAPVTANSGKSTGKGPASESSAGATSSTISQFNDLTVKFNALSGAAVPLSQEIVTLEQSQATLQAWRAAVNEEYKSILGSLLTRVASIAFALLVIFGLSAVWRQATKRYVRDVRRRRQLLVVRRLLVGFLTGLVLIFGFVTQFSSLATFAGFITAGIAVGLQTILLSVAAYFSLLGGSASRLATGSALARSLAMWWK